MEWTFLVPFAGSGGGRWLDAFLPKDSVHSLHSIPAAYKHDGSRAGSSAAQWRDYAVHAFKGWSSASHSSGRSGIITCFPQLALMVGFRKRFSRLDLPVVAWTFNLGHLPKGAAGRIAGFGFRPLDRIVVHSRAEIGAYSRCFGLPPERFRFVPLQAPRRHVDTPEDRDQPFVVAMGSARRDYPLLIEALGRLGLPAVIVAAPHALEGISLPGNVQVRSGLTSLQCFELLQAARIHVIPIRNADTASGQVTLIDSMSFGRPTVVTNCIGTIDYATDRQEVLFVPQGNSTAMADAIMELWQDEALRTSLGERARLRSIREFSDEAIGLVLEEVLSEFT